MHNNQAVDNFKLPSILELNLLNRFTFAEKELILACSSFNKAKIFYKNNKESKVSKITMGSKIGIMIKDTENENNLLSFELDQKKFAGLVRKYRSDRDIRLMIRQLFVF